MSAEYKMNGLQSSEFNVRTIVEVVLNKWHWFALSVLLCLGAAWYYHQRSVPMFKHVAILLVKDEEKTENAFVEKQLFNTNSNLGNEKLMLKSRLLMTETLRRLGLDTEYKIREGLRKRVLYPEVPFRISFDSISAGTLSFSILPLSQKQFVIEDFEEDSEWTATAEFGRPVQTPGGRLVIYTTSHFDRVVGQGEKIYVWHSPVSALASAYLARLEVERADAESTLLTVSYEDSNAARAEAIIRTLAEAYNDDATQDRNQILLNTALFIDERLQIINRELGEVDGNIENYKKHNKLTDLSSEATLFLQNNNRSRQEVIELTNQMQLVQFIKSYLNDPVKQSELLPANSGIMDTGVEDLIAQYNEKMLIRNKLLKNSSERSPVVEELTDELATVKASVLYSLNNLYRSLQIRRDEARRQEDLASGRIGSVPTQERYILSVERQLKIKEELYLYLLNKREENALSMATVENKVRVIDPPYSSGMSSGLSLMVLLLAAGVIGLLIPGAYFYVQPMLDMTVRGRKDIKEALTVPFLGEIPRKKKIKGTIVVDQEDRDGVSEAFRILRSNLDFVLDKEPGGKVLMFTSANPDSGKTFISSNMAVSLSLTGKRVILLNMDIRKGSGYKRDGSVFRGITHYLSGKVSRWEELVHQPVQYPGLHILHSGPTPPNPAELLLSSRLDTLIKEAKEKYDYVLVDTVPYGIMADAQIINRIADVTIYVIREGLMDRRMLPEIEALYRDHKLRNLVIILNDSGIKHTGYGYGYNSYGYGYTYGGKKRKAKKKTNH